MVDASNAKTHELEGVKQLEVLTAPKLLLINKIDKVPRSSILPIIDRFDKMHVFHDILPVSALKAEGLDTLISIILDVLPEGDPFYSPDAVSDEPERFFVSELIREKIYFNYGEEIPYSTAVIIDEFQERPGRKDYIRAIVMVERDSQKGILIGKGGKALKKVGRQSRESIEAFLDRPVFLDLHIQVRKKWRKDKSQVKRLGYS